MLCKNVFVQCVVLGILSVGLYAADEKSDQIRQQYGNLYDGANRAPAAPEKTPAPATGGFSFDAGFQEFLPGGGGPSRARLRVSASFVPPVDEQPGVLSITAEIPEGWSIYSISQQEGGPLRTVLHLPVPDKIRPAGKVTVSPAPKISKDEIVWGNLLIEKHEKDVTWKVPFLWSDPNAVVTEISGAVEAQMCNPETCFDPEKFSFTARPVASFPERKPEAVETVVLPMETPTPPPAKTTEGVTEPTDSSSNRALGTLLLMAYLGGLILNLMPCVLPVIAPKLYSFVHQSGESRARVFLLNVSYTLGLLTVLWILAALSRLGDLLPGAENMAWGEQFTYTGFVIFMTSLVFVMGLSFLGVWEIPIPGFVAGGSLGKMQRKEGLFGAFCMGILTTLLATPCVGPFLGTVFGALIGQPVVITFLVFTVIGLGLASPYLIVGIFPSWIRFLPKPGAWMETLKEVMGFFFMGVVVWLFSLLSPGQFVPMLSLLFALWFSCWLIGKVSFSGASTGKVLTAWVVGILFAAGVGIVMFQLAETGEVSAASRPEQGILPWEPFSLERVEELKREKKVVFIDFTANWCLTCRTNRTFAIETRNVAELLKHRGIVPVLADWTNRDAQIKEYLHAMGRSSIPLIVIWTPKSEQPILLDGILTEGQLLQTLESAAFENQP
ncbi:MAG: cytochrome c biogenesis protein CcdA [Planctomycetia bacterium]|nr:cytochrome c biogenesis protein CcdA [Planctomycetia bacterium]